MNEFTLRKGFAAAILMVLLVDFAAAWPASPCNPCIARCTFTQGGWSAPSQDHNPGWIRDTYFSTVYPGGLTIGGFYTILFTGAAAIDNFLPQGHTPAVLTQSYVDPPPTPLISEFVGQVLALQLNVDFGNAGAGGMVPISSLVIASGPFAGSTVAQLLLIANAVLGGNVGALPAGTTLGDLNTACTVLNENFDGCVENDGYLLTPPEGSTVYVRNLGEVLPRPFCLNFTAQCPDICVIWWCRYCDENHDFAFFSAVPGCAGPECAENCTPNPGFMTGFETANQHVIGPDPTGFGCWWYMRVHASAPGCFCVMFDIQLPVELLSFTAAEGHNEVTLAWTTASETNNDYYELLRDNIAVAQVPGMGDDATGYSYMYRDNTVANGTAYHYTLISVDANGRRSELRSVEARPSADVATISAYALYQNYPNPFNPATSISFDLLANGDVTLKVYNLMGQEVASLISGSLPAGHHVVGFDASALPSAIYLYRLNSGGFTAERKMLLIK